MFDDGRISRFDLQRMIALHNLPGLPIGAFATRLGPITALTARLDINIIVGEAMRRGMRRSIRC